MSTRGRKSRIVVLGGGYAGLLAAARVTEAANAEVTLVDARPEFTQRIRLHEMLAGLPVRTFPYAPLLGGRGIRFVQGWVERLEPKAGRVLGRGADGERLDLPYDHLVLALGSRTGPGAPGAAEHALRLDDPERVRQAAARLPALARSGSRVLVVGGGLTGLETAAELGERYPGLRVTLAASGRLGDGFAPAAGVHFRGRLGELGVEVLEGTTVEALEAGQVHLAGRGVYPFELCVWAAGFEPPALAREARLGVSQDGRAVVDGALRSVTHPEVWVAGDTALVETDGRPVRMSCAAALPMGAHAGANLRRLLRAEPLQAFDFGFSGRCVSLGRRDALVQFTDRADQAGDRLWTGRRAVLTKEAICRMTLAVPRWEVRTGMGIYRWPGAGADRRTLPAAVGRRKEHYG